MDHIVGTKFPLGTYVHNTLGIVHADRHLVMSMPPDSYVEETLQYCGVGIVDRTGKRWSCYCPQHDLRKANP